MSTVAAVSSQLSVPPLHMQSQQQQRFPVQEKVLMNARGQLATHNLTRSLKKTGTGQIAKSEEILSWGCDVVLEPVNAAPSPVFLRGALAEHSRRHQNWNTIQQLAEQSPEFGQRVLSLDGRHII